MLGVVILSVTVLASLFYTTQDIQFAGAGIKQVTDSGVNLTVLACNPSFFPQEIETVQAVLYSQSNEIGTLEITGKTVPSNSVTTMDGTITLQDFSSMRNFIGWLADGNNPQDFKATVLVQTKILGIVPHSYQKNYDFPRFTNLIFGTNQWSCSSKQGLVDASDIKQDLILAKSRLSAAELLYNSNGMLENATKNETKP